MKDEESGPKFYHVVEAQSDGVTLTVPAFTLPATESLTWERLRIHAEVERMDWPTDL